MSVSFICSSVYLLLAILCFRQVYIYIFLVISEFRLILKFFVEIISSHMICLCMSLVVYFIHNISVYHCSL